MMDISLKKIPYEFKDPPLVVGGKAMEYYGLREAGDDVDLIVSERDFEALLKLFPDRCGTWDIETFIRYENFEIWKSIRLFDYEFYKDHAVFLDGYGVISIERLVWLKGLYVKEPKSVKDLELISDYVMRKQYKKHLKEQSRAKRKKISS